MMRSALLPLTLLATACTQPGGTSTAEPLVQCLFADVHQVSLELDGETLAGAELRVSNACDTPVPVSVELDGSTAFSVIEAPETVPAFGEGAVVIRFVATGIGEASGSLSIRGDQHIEIPIEAVVHGPEIHAAAPEASRTPAGCTSEHTILVVNRGDREGTVLDVTLSESEAFRLTSPSLPATLAPGASLGLPVHFDARGAAPASATLVITSDDPIQGRTQVALADESFHANPQSITDTVPHPIVDILLTMDRSSCNTDHLEAVPDAIERLQAGLAGADYQLGIVTSDDGCVIGDDLVIDASFDAAAAARAAATMIDADFVQSPYGSNTQRGLTLAEAALDASEKGGCNEGLIREDAFLHLVHHSHEHDQSAREWSAFVAAFRERTGGRVMHHAVVGARDSECAAPGYGYLDAQEATGGLWMDYCDVHEDWTPAWDRHFDALSAHIQQAGEHAITLPVAPVPGEAVQVRVAGEPVDTWTYDAEARAITLPRSVARPGTTVEVSWSGLPETCP